VIREWWRQWREKHPPRPFRVCLDDYREIMCENLTAEEYEQHINEQRRIGEFIHRRRCESEMNPGCV
jgi:P2-related tail formation protein